jgi:hypothetical protein
VVPFFLEWSKKAVVVLKTLKILLLVINLINCIFYDVLKNTCQISFPLLNSKCKLIAVICVENYADGSKWMKGHAIM